jgi:glycosyltransferase involved in cell wall biosynthesis
MTADAVGSVWTYALELTRALQTFDIEVYLAVMGPAPTSEQQHDARAIPNLKLFIGDYKIEWMPDSRRDLRRAADWLLNLESRFAPDVIHLNEYAHTSLGWTSPTLVVGHSCRSSWWAAVRNAPAPAEWREYRLSVEEALRAADLVVTPSQAMLDALREHYGSDIHGRVIPMGLNPDCFSQGLKQKFILTSGRLWDEAKNIQKLIEVAPGLPWAVCLSGDTRGPDGSAIDGVNKRNCYLLGRQPVETLRLWCGRAWIYVLPARYEPFGLTVLEAALSGCALVLGDIDSLNENWKDAAVFVDPDSNANLRAAIIELINNESYRLKLSRLARDRAMTFTTTRMGDEYANAYRELVGTQQLGRLSMARAAS